MMGMGNPIIRLYILISNVFYISLPKYTELKNSLNHLNPTHSLCKNPFPTE